MTTVEELIADLTKHPPEADVVVWEWSPYGTVQRHIELGLNKKSKETKKYFIVIDEKQPPIGERK